MIRPTLFTACLALAACGSGPDATLYVEDAGALIDQWRDAQGGEDAADASDDTRRDTTPDAAGDTTDDTTRPGPDAVADTGSTDVAPDAPVEDTGLGPACGEIDRSLDFGNRIAGQTHEEVLFITSCGGFDDSDLVVSTIEFVNDAMTISAPEFFFAEEPPVPISVLPNDRWPLQVRYRPETPGSHNATIRIVTNDPNNAEIRVAVSASVSD